jgi:ABC-type transport system substrate-binding protein
VAGDTVVQTVIVEKEVKGETIVQTVEVEKIVIDRVVETVVVEQPPDIVVVTATPQPDTSVADEPVIQFGTLIVAVPEVGTPSGLIRDAPYWATLADISVQETMFRNFRGDDGGIALSPNLVESWAHAPDGSYTDFKVREGIQFHRGFGELTAEDLAYTYNEANPATQPLSNHDTGGALPPVLAEVLPQSRYVARFPWLAFNAVTFTTTLSDYSEGYGIASKSAIVDNGDDWSRQNMIGTGPYIMEDFTAGKGIEVRAADDHWRKAGTINLVKWLEIPEGSTRRAMLETGEAQIAHVEVKDYGPLSEDGFLLAPEGVLADQAWVYGGNYWETVHPTSGVALERTRNTDLPWVGDPNDPASMERSLKVRQALNMAFERDVMNEALADGLGRPSYLGGISDQDPVFLAHADEWTIPYDPDKSRALIAEAGYAPDEIELDFWIGPSGLQREVGEALAAAWAEIGVKTVLDLQVYSTFRPSRINRTSDQLSFFGASGSPAVWPIDWLLSAIVANEDGTPGGGFNSGVEIEPSSTAQVFKLSSDDAAASFAATEVVKAYHFEQALWPGVFEVAQAPMYNPALIESWDLAPPGNNRVGGVKHPEFIVLK